MSDEISDFVPLKKEELFNSLISIGLNTINSSYNYRPEFKAIIDSFLSLPIHEISGKWKHLDPGVKLKIIDTHEDAIFSRLLEASNE